MFRNLIYGPDTELFLCALQCYLDTTNHEKSGYTYETRRQFVEMHLRFFSDISPDKYKVIAEIKDNEAVGIAIGFSNDIIIGRPEQSILPGWHLAFTWRKNYAWGSPKSFIFDITNPISSHMESLGIFDFTKVLRVSIPSLKRLGIQQYVDRVILKNLPDSRYDAFIDAVVCADTDISKLPLLYKKILPEKILTPKIIIKHSLKNYLRSNLLAKI